MKDRFSHLFAPPVRLQALSLRSSHDTYLSPTHFPHHDHSSNCTEDETERSVVTDQLYYLPLSLAV